MTIRAQFKCQPWPLIVTRCRAPAPAPVPVPALPHLCSMPKGMPAHTHTHTHVCVYINMVAFPVLRMGAPMCFWHKLWIRQEARVVFVVCVCAACVCAVSVVRVCALCVHLWWAKWSKSNDQNEMKASAVKGGRLDMSRAKQVKKTICDVEEDLIHFLRKKTYL